MFDALSKIEMAHFAAKQAKALLELATYSYDTVTPTPEQVEQMDAALHGVMVVLDNAIDEMGKAVSEAYDVYYAQQKQPEPLKIAAV